MITVFTPAYNRAYCIENLYKSLLRQTDKDFEWVVVDDGSTDDTEALISSFIADNKISITYIRQANGGKHTAINRGLDVAQGSLFIIVDSDDYLTDDAIETISEAALPIAEDESMAGVIGLRVHQDGRAISAGITAEQIDATALELRFRYGITGDLAEVVKTQVLKKYTFPVFEGEKFSPEALVWNRIANDGLKFRLINKAVYCCEYLPDGLTAGIVKARMKSPRGTVLCYSELSAMNIPYHQKIKAAINYWRFRCCAKGKVPGIALKWIWTFPLGLLMHLNDLRVCK